MAPSFTRKTTRAAICIIFLEIWWTYVVVGDCTIDRPLGMANYQILNSQIKASSSYGPKYVPANGRLNLTEIDDVREGCWRPDGNDNDPWIQVDFIENTTVTEIQTQGRNGYSSWVETYKVSYSYDGINFQDYIENGATKIFTANNDMDSIVRNAISPPVFTRVIRIHPLLYERYKTMRIEFRGCSEGADECESNPCQNGATCYDFVNSFKCVCGAGYSGSVCEKDCTIDRPLGMANYQILNSQISASSFATSKYVPAYGRLNLTEIRHVRGGCWRPDGVDNNPWIQVDFIENATVTEIQTQGENGGSSWVRTYKVSYSYDGTNFQDYMEDGATKTFIGNNDRDSIVRNIISPPIFTRVIRIYPLAHNNYRSMRVEFRGCSEGTDECASNPCQNGATCYDFVNSFKCVCGAGYSGSLCEKDCTIDRPLGMANYQILNSQISASSYPTSKYVPAYGRLNLTEIHLVRGGCWRPDTADNNPWIQVDFIENATVTEIQTQGQNGGTSWVKTYKVSYSYDGTNFHDYIEDGATKTFIGNNDMDSIVRNIISPPIFTSVIRIYPLAHNNYRSMRVEFRGCSEGTDECASNPCQNGATCYDFVNSFKCVCGAGYSGSVCEKDCTTDRPLGMANYQILDSQISASSSASSKYVPSNGRLNLTEINDVREGCWRPDGNDNDPWIQVDFIENATVTEIQTQGKNGGTSWVKTYKVSYSYDGTSFHDYIEDGATKTFIGNNDMDSIVRNIISPPIFTRVIRIYPLAYNNARSMRVEFRGCSEGPCSSSPCQNGGTCIDHNDSFNCTCPSNYSGVNCEIAPGPCLSNPCKNGGTCNEYNTSFNCTCPVTYSGVHCELGCQELPLGMESGAINDIGASTEYSSTYAANLARLRGTGVWTPKITDQNPSHTVYLPAPANVTGFATQGRSSYDYWVTSYKIASRGVNDGQFSFYEENGQVKVFSGNSDRNTIVRHNFSPVLFTDAITLYPVTKEGSAAIRIEYYGCYDAISYCSSFPCQNGGSCHAEPGDYICICPLGYTGRNCEATDHCSPNPCQNGGACENNFTSPQCYCGAGYTGTFCEETDSSPQATTVQPITTQAITSQPIQTNTVQPITTQAITSQPIQTNTVQPITTQAITSQPIRINTMEPTTIQATTPQPATTHPVTNDDSISDFFLTPITQPIAFGVLITIAWSMQQGTNVSVVIHYNDIVCCNSGANETQCDCLVSDPGHFDRDGVVDIRAEARNPVSTASDTIQVEVLMNITGVSISMLTSYSDFGSGVEGRGNLRNIFPAEYPVKFNLTFSDGPITTIEWDFSCSVGSVTKETTFFFTKTFPSSPSRECDITLVTTNGISTATVSRTIALKESFILTSMTNDGPSKENSTITITISLEKFGTGTCMTVDMGDNSSLLVFGDGPSPCVLPGIFSEKSPSTNQIVIQHRYLQLGTYTVKMNAANNVSMATEETIVVVLGYVCHNPNVTITGLSPNTSNILNAAQVYRSVPIALSLEIQKNCENTELTTISWDIFRFDDDPHILNTMSNMNVGNLRKTLYYTGFSSSDLLLPGRDLPYGFYEVSVRVEMKGLPDVFGRDLLYIQIVQTPWIKASVTSGSFYTVPYGKLGLLNASASSDPDFAGTDGMSFSWYCKDIDDDEFLLTNLTHEVLLSIPRANNDSIPLAPDSLGCFGTGRGRLNETSPFLELDTGTMVEDKTYSIALVISKDHPEFGRRQAIVNTFFYVAAGLPPELHTSCLKNCGEKINRNDKLILSSTCNSNCYGKLKFGWFLYSYDDANMPEPYNLTDLNEIPMEQFQNMASNPIDELDLAIKPYSLEAGKKYILAFRATRPSGVFGELRYTMLVNSPPANGNCSISHLSGVAMKTNFTLSCEKWTDPESPLTYEFSYESKGTRTVFFYRSVASGQSISMTDWLPVGDGLNDYNLNVSIHIKDNQGAGSEHKFYIKVVPPPKEDINVIELKTMVSGEGNLLERYIQNGNSQGAISLASSLISVLDHIGQDSSSNASLEDKSGEGASEQVRLGILKSLSKTPVTGVSSFLQMSGTVRLLTEKTDELLPEAKDMALDMCESLTDNLKVLSDDDKGFENIQQGASNVLGVVGAMSTSFTNDSDPSPEAVGDKAKGAVQRSVGLVHKVQSVVLDNLVTNEGSASIETDTLSLQVEKVAMKDFGKKANELQNSRFKPPSVAAFGLEEDLNDENNTFLQMQPVMIKMASFKKNPFIWSSTSKTVTSNVVDIVLDSNLNMTSSNFSEEIAVTVARDSSQFPEPDKFFLKPSVTNETAKTKRYLKYHCYTRTSNYTSVNFDMQPEDFGIHFKVYLKKGGKPDIENGDFEHSFELPDLSSCAVDNENIFHSKNGSDKSGQDEYEPIYIDVKNCSRRPYTVFLSNADLNGIGEYCFAIQHIQRFQPNMTSNARVKRSVSCEVGKRRVRRSCVIIPPAPPKPTPYRPTEILVADNLGFDGKFFYPNQTPNYNMTMFESSCVYWNIVNETWEGPGCRVALGTNKEQILCYCNHLTSFGSDLLVAPNPIDFDAVFQNFDSLAENVAVLALISTILGLYIIGVVWARRADKRDDIMVGPTILSSPAGPHKYLVSLHTGNRQQAGTTARVVFKISGDMGETIPVRLRDRHRPCFERGQDNAFVVSYPRGVGDVSYVQIWHDNSGSSPSWYLSRMSVKDLQTGKQWFFMCEKWLAVESEDGKVCRVLPVANNQELTNFSHLFTARTIKGLADGHIWFSIVSRPPTSNFTRVQRLSCALCLLCCTMITSAMFYNMGGQGPSPFTINIGSLVVDLKPFVIGLQSSIIIVPVNVAIVQIFRNLRPKKKKKDRKSKRPSKPLEDGVLPDEQEAKVGEGKPQTSQGKLPHWFIYIAYALCYLASGASIFFTLLYSIQWGKETSTEWVIAMVTSFFQSVLLLQPIKVVLAAVIFALIIRKPCDTEEETNEVPLVEETQVSAQSEKEKTAENKPKRRRKKHYRPPSPEKLQRARVKRLKEIKMNEAIKEIIAFFFFLVLLMMVALHHRDPNAFLLTKTLSETFDEVDAFAIDLSAVSDQDSLWMWARETLIPGLYGTNWYNGQKNKKGYIGNMEDYLVGVPRVRLLRVEKDSCSVPSHFKDAIPHCYSGYSVANEEKESFNIGWKPLVSGSSRKRRDVQGPDTETKWLELMTNASDETHSRKRRAMDPITSGSSGKNRRKKKRLLASASPKVYIINDNAVLPGGKVLSCLERWRHQTMIELRGFPYWGTITMYSGSGYVANLGYDPVTAYTVVADLHSNGWIDVQTRAVFVEFTVYNANTNLFGIISLFIEFPPSSSTVMKAQFQAAQFYLQLSSGQLLAHILVIFFMLYFLYREGKLVYKQRLAYFKGFWNWVETILVFCEFATIVLFLARLYEVDRNLIQLRENPNDYVGFQYAGSAAAALSYVLGVLVFFYNIRFLRLLRFNKNFLVIGKSLSRMSAPILGFCIPFFFGFIAFGLFAFSVFGSELEDYSSFMMTMVTQFSMTLGDFDFEALVSVSPVLGSLYFFAFIGLNVIVLMNVFLAIINDTFAEVQEENADLENEYEIVDYVTAKLRRSFHATFSRGKVRPKKKIKKRRKNKKKKKGVLPTSTKERFDELDSRGKRLDKLVEEIEGSLKHEAVVDEKFSSVPEERRQDLYFRVLCLIESLDDDDDYDDLEDLSDWSDQSDE